MSTETESPIEKYRQGGMYWNSFGNGPQWTMEDLPLTDEQKVLVLEWFARKIFRLQIDLGIQDGICKSYDPLLIEGHTAHSYVFDLDDGGRHHDFKDYADLEERLYKEMFTEFKNRWKLAESEDEEWRLEELAARNAPPKNDTEWPKWVLDATSFPNDDGLYCFCPMGDDGSIVVGMNLLSTGLDKGRKLVGVFHPDGQQAVEAWCAKHEADFKALQEQINGQD